MTTSLNFFKQYHSTVIKALGKDAKKMNAKVGSIMADNWADKAGNINSNSEFAKNFENYLKYQLEFAKYVKVNCDEKDYMLDIKGCCSKKAWEKCNNQGCGQTCHCG
jgi:hypothetical protein